MSYRFESVRNSALIGTEWIYFICEKTVTVAANKNLDQIELNINQNWNQIYNNKFTCTRLADASIKSHLYWI